MDENKRILEAPLPLDKLQKVGITRQSFEAMPNELKQTLLSGHVTPLMLLHVRTAGSKKLAIPMKLQLAFDKNNQLQLITYQINKEVSNHLHLTDKEMNRVKAGEAIMKEFKIGNNRKMRYVQMDKETNSLMYRDAATVKLEKKLAEIEKIKDIGLGLGQKEAALNGKPIELAVGDQKVSVGVDLREPQGFKVVNGDMDEWKRQQAIRYDNSHEGFLGYVQTDENRWEYKQVVDKLRTKEQIEMTETQKKEVKKKSGIKM